MTSVEVWWSQRGSGGLVDVEDRGGAAGGVGVGPSERGGGLGKKGGEKGIRLAGTSTKRSVHLGTIIRFQADRISPQLGPISPHWNLLSPP